MNRTALTERSTSETTVSVRLNLDGSGRAEIRTGLGFLDHMLVAFTKHSRIDLSLACDGDLVVDDHHTVEDCALVLGAAINEALGDRRGVRRFGCAYAPLDEALARVVVDLSGRPFSVVELGLRREFIGDVATENLTHFFQSLCVNARCAIHVDLIRGDNDHHRVEAAFKALALAMREAVSLGADDIASTKGVLT